MTPQIDCLEKNEPCSDGFNTHLWCCQGDRQENVHSSRKPRHVKPQIDRLGKMSPVLRDSTPIYGVSKEIDGKTWIFQSKPRHVNPQIDCLEKNKPCSDGFNTHVWCFQGDRWENVHFSSKPRHVTPQINHLSKNKPCPDSYNTHFWWFLRS